MTLPRLIRLEEATPLPALEAEACASTGCIAAIKPCSGKPSPSLEALSLSQSAP